jgi:hypothetical protein
MGALRLNFGVLDGVVVVAAAVVGVGVAGAAGPGVVEAAGGVVDVDGEDRILLFLLLILDCGDDGWRCVGATLGLLTMVLLLVLLALLLLFLLRMEE